MTTIRTTVAIGAAVLSIFISLVVATTPTNHNEQSVVTTSQFMEEIHPFTIAIPQATLDEIQTKLALAQFPESYQSDVTVEQKWQKGTSVQYLKELREYWWNKSTSAHHYDWRIREKQLNEQFPQFITRIDEFDVHFIHARSTHPNALPLLFTHGWPGSFLECTRIIPLLTQPTVGQQAFHVVCPSIPGYGFSSKPTRSGFGARQAADVFAELMTRLDYDRYVAQGGDWGAVINSFLAQNYPQHLIGLHVNMAVVAPPFNLFATRNPFYAAWRAFTTVLDIVFMKWRFETEEVEMITSPLNWGYQQTGYFHEQSTKPDTLGIALHDSPIGLASWLVEKYRMWSDCDGDVERRFPKQDLLDHIMVYYTTRTITSSMRFYYETTHDDGQPLLAALMNWQITVPTAFAGFPKELGRSPKKWMEEYYHLKQYHLLPSGGHFAALEEPVLLVDDLRTFVTTHLLNQESRTVTTDDSTKTEL